MEGFYDLANYPNDSTSKGSRDVQTYYGKTLPNVIYNNDTSMNLTNLTKTADLRASKTTSPIKDAWKKNIDPAHGSFSTRQAECENTGNGDQFAHLSNLASTFDTSSRLRCGWIHNETNPSAGRGALGISSGPLNSSVPGKWIWDLNDAKQKYQTAICKNVKNCGDIDARMYTGKCGWCTKSGKGVPINGSGKAAYPFNPNTACAPSKLVTTGGNCPVEGFVNPYACTPNENGSLTRDCLLQKAVASGCSDKGTLYQALKAGSNNDYMSNLRAQQPWSIYQSRAAIPVNETSLKSGKITIANALDEFGRIQEQAASDANNGLQYAARDLCFEKGAMDTYDFCSEITDTTTGPFSLNCIQKAFLRGGGQTTGRKYPTTANVSSYNSLGNWSAVKAAIQAIYSKTLSSDRATQEAAMLDFYGIQLQDKSAPAFAIANVGFVRIVGTGKAGPMNLSQLVVYDENGNNVSKGRPVQSSGSPYGPPGSGGRGGASEEMANDGGESSRAHPYEFHGKGSGTDLWQVHLVDGPRSVSSVVVYNRSDCCQERMGSGYVIELYSPLPNPSLLWRSEPLTSAPVQTISVSYNPSNVPLSQLQQMFNNAGCTNTLAESDVWWWRGRPTLSGIQDDMNAYGSLTRNCTGDSRQHEFCIRGKCKQNQCKAPMGNPTDGAEYKYMGCFKDDPSRTISTYLNDTQSTEECWRRVTSNGFNVMGRQYFGQCFGGNNTDWNRLGSAGCCEPIGGGYTNQVFVKK